MPRIKAIILNRSNGEKYGTVIATQRKQLACSCSLLKLTKMKGFPVLPAFSAQFPNLAPRRRFPTLHSATRRPRTRLQAPRRRWKRPRAAGFQVGQAAALVFTCNHCPSAQYNGPRLKQLVEDFQKRGVAVVAIMPNDPKSVRLDELGWTDLSDSFAEMKDQGQALHYNFPYYTTATPKVYRAPTGQWPHRTHSFLTPQRKLRYVGAIDDSERVEHVTTHYVRDALEALLAGKEPPKNKTKVVGCSIKWAGKADL